MQTLDKACESCKLNPAAVEEPTEVPTQPYQLCNPCHERLLKRSLKPIEWFNLAVIHSPSAALLHDDFYEEDGEATQPDEEVIVTRKELAPSLKKVKRDLNALIDFSITRWYLETDVINALKKHNKDELLQASKTRFYRTDVVEIKKRMLEIASEVLEGHAAEWIRELWNQYEEDLLVELSEATASSLPIQEGLQNVFGKLEALDDKERNACVASCLYHFRSPEVLMWIEKNCRTFHDNWGRLAAVSYPTWKTMKKWLSMGRPLSLVALDAMEVCADEDRYPIIKKYKPQILRTNLNEIETVIEEYLKQDSVPRVKNKSEWILEDKEIIFTIKEI